MFSRERCMEMVNRLGLEYISVFGLSPVQFVHLAADLGCANIGTGLAPLPYNPHGYPAWSLLDDRALRRETVAALRERGVTLASGEDILIWPRSEERRVGEECVRQCLSWCERDYL